MKKCPKCGREMHYNHCKTHICCDCGYSIEDGAYWEWRCGVAEAELAETRKQLESAKRKIEEYGESGCMDCGKGLKYAILKEIYEILEGKAVNT